MFFMYLVQNSYCRSLRYDIIPLIHRFYVHVCFWQNIAINVNRFHIEYILHNILYVKCKNISDYLKMVNPNFTRIRKKNYKKVIFMLTCFCLPQSFSSSRLLCTEYIHFRLNWNSSRASADWKQTSNTPQSV